MPEEFRGLLQSVGTELRLMPAGQSLRQKLCWRFQVANDPGVGRFLVRDWWSHTDPILAGMWGGIAGVLPDLQALLEAYQPAAQETANVGQDEFAAHHDAQAAWLAPWIARHACLQLAVRPIEGHSEM